MDELRAILKILALDTATTACSVALNIDGDTVAWRFEAMGRGHSEALMPMVVDVLAEAGLAAKDCDLIAVTRGPGGFTGLRIGLAAARGLALAAGVTCVGVATTEAIAEAARAEAGADQAVLVALDSKRADVFVQLVDADGKARSEPQAVGLDGVAAWLDEFDLKAQPLVVGDAAERVLEQLDSTAIRGHSGDIPDAKQVAFLAWRQAQSGVAFSAPSPLYLRPPDAALPENGGRLRP